MSSFAAQNHKSDLLLSIPILVAGAVIALGARRFPWPICFGAIGFTLLLLSFPTARLGLGYLALFPLSAIATIPEPVSRRFPWFPSGVGRIARGFAIALLCLLPLLDSATHRTAGDMISARLVLPSRVAHRDGDDLRIESPEQSTGHFSLPTEERPRFRGPSACVHGPVLGCAVALHPIAHKHEIQAVNSAEWSL